MPCTNPSNVLLCGKNAFVAFEKDNNISVRNATFGTLEYCDTWSIQTLFTDNMLHVHFSKYAHRKKVHYAYNYADIDDNCSSNHAIYMALPFCCTLCRLSCVCPTLPFHPLCYCSYSANIAFLLIHDYIYLVWVSFWLFRPLAYLSYRIKLNYNLFIL